jgi:cellulase/cellobiase CelA1
VGFVTVGMHVIVLLYLPAYAAFGNWCEQGSDKQGESDSMLSGLPHLDEFLWLERPGRIWGLAKMA